MDKGTPLIVNAEIRIIQNLLTTRYFTAAGLVLLLYDTVVTMDDEVRLVWPGPLKIPKVLYFINRYWSIASLMAANYLFSGFQPPLSTNFCQAWIFVAAFAEMIAEVATSAIIVLRVTALYERKTWIVRGLWIIAGLLYSTTWVLGIFTIKSFYKSFIYDPLSGVCLSVDISNKSYPMFAIPLAFDVIVMALTTFKTYRLAVAVRKESGAVILYTMLWDGIMYFIIIVSLRILNTVVWAILPNSFVYLGIYTYRGLISTMTSRLFLNLRVAARDRPNYVQDQPTTVFPPGGRQDKPRESVQTGHRKMTLDTTLSATISSVERGTYAEIEQMFNRHALETQLTENRHESEMELQPRGKHIGIR